MNSREPRELDALGSAIHADLLVEVGQAKPPAKLRARLLLRVANQHRLHRWLTMQLFAEAAEPHYVTNWDNLAWDYVAYFSLLRGVGLGGIAFH